MRVHATLVVLCLMAAFCYAQVASDQIQNLPGLTQTPSFKQYAGYMNVTGFGRMFYWFVESQNNPATDPMVLWLNGGPGCSSLGGLLTENGPFLPNAQLQLETNPYSWNRIANVLYVESPPGVGFSVNEASFRIYTDNRTAEANYQFLQQWFASYESFQSNDFWITGESYAGHYIPTLTHQILAHQNSGIPLNLKGIAIGNPSTDFDFDTGPLYESYFPTHGLECLDPELDGRTVGIIDPYDILADVCYETSLMKRVRWENPTVDRLREKWERIRSGPHARQVPEQPPCIEEWMTNYLNQHSVQQAIHAVPTNWEQCGGPPYHFGQESILPYYREILSNSSLRVFIYSGDEDTVLPFIGTEMWVLSLKQKNQNFWGPWYSEWSGNGPQVAGYWIDFGRLWYATVKGAGHMVPWFQPGPAFDMFERYITGQSLHGSL